MQQGNFVLILEMEPLKQMEKKKFYCEICEKEFSRNQNKKQHVNLVHVEEKIFACNLCIKL